MASASINRLSTSWPMSAAITPRQWVRHCRRTFPFTATQPKDLDRRLYELQTALGVQRRCMASALKRGFRHQVQGHRQQIDRLQSAIRNGEALARATGWPFQGTVH